MLPGPIFYAELVTTARRRRYYAIRVLYASVLLLLIWSNYTSVFRSLVIYDYGGGPFERRIRSIALMSQFAQAMFRSLAIAQGIAVVALTPALVAGTIASEKQRKTLHYLLASHLTSEEIVLGKLLARLLHIGVFLTLGLPIISLLSLFGGVDPLQVGLADAAAASTALFLSGLSILCSTIARRTRSAIGMAYGLTLLWLVFPYLIDFLMFAWPQTLGYVMVGIEGAYPLIHIGRSDYYAPGALESKAIRMVLLQLAYGPLLIAIAARRLRPIAQRQEGRPRWEIRLDERGRRRWRLLPRPPCGHDAMFWKEKYTARIGGIARLLLLLLNLTGLVLLGCFLWECGLPALRDQGGQGLLDLPNSHNRSVFNDLLGSATALIYLIWLIGTAVTAATSIAGEREEDTWITLVSTTLTGTEILRAKMAGAVLRLRWLALVLAFLWGFGLLARSIHPLSILGAAVEMAVFLGFAAALGVFFSLRSTSTIRALAWTIGTLVLLNGGSLLCCLPFTFRSDWAWLGISPRLVYETIVPWGQRLHAYGYGGPPSWPEAVITADLILLPAYTLAGLLLWLSSLARFDALLDRPRRPGFPIEVQDPPGGPRARPFV
ncbi:MAG: ABC transporter permease subunit [Isosphaeraceae bacterium]|nr:ABC transporter permease subunit [Isosphaeraceae bacterium]